MSFDLYADLAVQSSCPDRAELPAELASGFVDGCTYSFVYNEIEAARVEKELQREHDENKKRELRKQKKERDDAKNQARKKYCERAAKVQKLELPADLSLDAASAVLQPGWLAVEVSFTLETPWYSKDDRPFHVLDNPVRKDRVFGVPFMSAASWKGLLRWSCRMEAGLREHLEKPGGSLEGWNDPAWIVHLFGNEKGESEDFQRGALAFYPTWFSRVAFEVINPHSRKTRAGQQPIYYEVVPPDTKGTLYLLYAPLPGEAARDGVEPKDALGKLLEAVEKLLAVYGFAAKRTAGWGLATINEWEARGCNDSKRGSRDDVIRALHQLLQSSEVRP